MKRKERLYIDDLDGAVTLFKCTEEGTETIAVFDEEHREVIQFLAKQANRFYELWESCNNRYSTEYRLMLAHEYFNGMDIDSDDFSKWLSFLKDTDEDEWQEWEHSVNKIRQMRKGDEQE
jgi:hypothetical protein